MRTMQAIDRVACDHKDHLSSAKEWMLLSEGVSHSLDYDCRLLPPRVLAPLQRELRDGTSTDTRNEG